MKENIVDQKTYLASKSFKFAWAICFMLLWWAVSCLLAFPFKWCWNYGATWAFKAPVIEWGHAFCLLVLIGFYKPAVVERDYKPKS